MRCYTVLKSRARNGNLVSCFLLISVTLDAIVLVICVEYKFKVNTFLIDEVEMLDSRVFNDISLSLVEC